MLHRTAKLTPFGRRLLVDRVLIEGWPAATAAEQLGVSRATAYKWLRRYRAEAPSAAPSVPPLSGEIQVVLLDTMRFAPDPITVKAGEEVTFVVKNDGVAVHELFVGTEEEQTSHAAEMAAGGMSHGHDNALSLKGGKSDSLTMTLPEAKSMLVGCHEPGHYEAGMKATLTVVD
jgi:uncharacterized cupredoxin-like copper-binding protein